MEKLNFDQVFKIAVLILLIAILIINLNMSNSISVPVEQSSIGKYKEFKDEHGNLMILNTQTGYVKYVN